MLTFLCLALCLTTCSDEPSPETLRLITASMYPPFEYRENSELKGFDIDLGRLIAKELGREPQFSDMPFNSLLAALDHDQADLAIATLTITAERQKRFDFSDPYYFESMAIVFRSDNPVRSLDELESKKIACQLGSTMELFLKKQSKPIETVVMDDYVQAVEALKAKHVDAVLMDATQARSFLKRNAHLGFQIIAMAKEGYGLAMKKGSLWRDPVNQALKRLEESGDLKVLKDKWFGD